MKSRLFYIVPVVLFSAFIGLTTQGCLEGFSIGLGFGGGAGGPGSGYVHAVEVPAQSPVTGLPAQHVQQTWNMACGAACCNCVTQYMGRGVQPDSFIFEWCGVPYDSGLTLLEMEQYMEWGLVLPCHLKFIPKVSTITAQGDSIARCFTYRDRVAIELSKNLHYFVIAGVAYDHNTGNGDTATSEICEICIMDPAKVNLSHRYNWVVMPLSQFLSECYLYSGGGQGYWYLTHDETSTPSPMASDPFANNEVIGPPDVNFKSLKEVRAFFELIGSSASYFPYEDRMVPSDSFFYYFPEPKLPEISRPFARRSPYPPTYPDADGHSSYQPPVPSDSFDVIRAIADTTRTAKFNIDTTLCDNPVYAIFAWQYAQMLSNTYVDEVIPTSREVFSDTLIPDLAKAAKVAEINIYQYGCIIRSYADNSVVGVQYIKNQTPTSGYTDLGTRLFPVPEDEEGEAAEAPPVEIEEVLEAYPGCTARFLMSDLRTDDQTFRTCQLPMIQVLDKNGSEVALIDWFSRTVMAREEWWIHPTDKKFIAESDSSEAPDTPTPTFALQQNSPNPFNPVTSISFSLVNSANVNLEVYNIMGQIVATLVDEYLPAGECTVTWDGADMTGTRVASGIYFYRLTVDGTSETKKMMLMK